MIKLPKDWLDKYPTLAASDAALVANQARKLRKYLGASGLGRPCERQQWYEFHHALVPEHGAETLKRFDDGHIGEEVMATRLREIGDRIELITRNPQKPDEQLNIRECHIDLAKRKKLPTVGGHLGGHLDGLIRGLLEAPETWHVWEHKQTSQEKFDKLVDLIEKDEKKALKRWDVTYYAQAQLYMHYAGCKRHFLTVSTPGGRQSISTRTNYEKSVAEELLKKAERIVSADVPLPKKATNTEYPPCSWCRFVPICHEKKLPRVSCRTCVHASPVIEPKKHDGKWICQKAKKDNNVIPNEIMIRGCHLHRYIPALLENIAEPIYIDDTNNRVEYSTPEGDIFINGGKEGDFSSWDIRMAAEQDAIPLLADDGIDQLRDKFGAKFLSKEDALE